MKDPTDVIVENVTEAYRRIDRLTLVSLVSSGWLIAVSFVNPTLSEGAPVPRPDLPFVGKLELPAVGLALLALVAFVTSGALMALYYRASRKAVKGLRRQSPDLARAVETFPSVATLSGVPRTLSFLFLGLLGVAAIILFSTPRHEPLKGQWAGLFIAFPYWLLTILAFIEAVSEHKQATDSA